MLAIPHMKATSVSQLEASTCRGLVETAIVASYAIRPRFFPNDPGSDLYSAVELTTPTGAKTYHLQVNRTKDLSGTSIMDCDSLGSAEYQLVDPLTSDKTYYWRVRVRKDGEWQAIQIPWAPFTRISG